nr:protein yippee-like [Ipomoea batatas]
MGRLFRTSLNGRVYSCKFCKTQLAIAEDIISKAFHCRHGEAYLFDKVYVFFAFPVLKFYELDYDHFKLNTQGLTENMILCVNVTLGAKEERMMITGMHTVVDTFCVACGALVGWKYETAHENSQKYKEGKFILERFMILGLDGSNYAVNQDAELDGSDDDEA